jgi:hypothetical protein
MFGCIGRLVTLVCLLAVVAAAWFTRDYWEPKLRARLRGAPAVTAASAPNWESLSNEGAARARAAVNSLSQRNGPVYVNVSPADLASFALDSVMHGITGRATGVQAMARDDRLYLRGETTVGELGGATSLGPLSQMLNGKQQLTLRGRLEVLKPGLGQFRVDDIEVGEVKLPGAMISKLISRYSVGKRDPAVAADAVPVRLPNDLADIRVGKGRITLYKSVP